MKFALMDDGLEVLNIDTLQIHIINYDEPREDWAYDSKRECLEALAHKLKELLDESNEKV